MSAARVVTIVCDGCRINYRPRAGTINGARRDAERHGWRVQYLADGRHPTKISGDPKSRDLCPKCRPDKPRTDVGLLGGEQP